MQTSKGHALTVLAVENGGIMTAVVLPYKHLYNGLVGHYTTLKERGASSKLKKGIKPMCLRDINCHAMVECMEEVRAGERGERD